MEHVELPAMYLGWGLAAKGPGIVPLVRTKLQEAKDDGSVTEIVLLFRIMNNAVRSYDVAGVSALMGQLREKVAAIENPTLKNTATVYLNKIASRSDK